jgi:hypothetical protein
MNAEPTTPVRVPKAASTYTPTIQDPDLRSQINTVLLRDGHVSKYISLPILLPEDTRQALGAPHAITQCTLRMLIPEPCRIQEKLLHALNASPANWPTLIQNHALALLRSGDCTTFPALVTQVLDDIRADTVAGRSQEGESNGTGAAGKNGKTNGNDAVGTVNGKGEGGQSLALPKTVVEEGLKITRECLELVVEVE